MRKRAKTMQGLARRWFGGGVALVCVLMVSMLVGCGGPENVTQSLSASEQRADLLKLRTWPTQTAQFAQPQYTSQHAVLPKTLPGVNPAPRNGFIAHEWGTFTSVQSSDGQVMEGLHHEEEPLPDFVFKRAKARFGKGMEVASQVTQKLETPVIYFYTRQPTKVSVVVDFPKGVISEWFPNATSFLPALGQQQAQLFVPQKGQMTWEVELLPGLKQAPPAVAPDDIWAPSREVPMATPLRFVDASSAPSPYKGTYVKKYIQNQVEKFIFYRGIGKFDGWFKVKAPTNQTLSLHNASTSPVPQVFVLRVANGKGVVKTLPGMKPNEHREVAIPSMSEALPMEQYVDKAAADVAKALIASGLYPKEAWAMVNTWRRSYFKSYTPGVRVLYIVPRADTDKLLPIKITPKPTQLVRTLVGRIEVLTPAVEAETIALLRTAMQQRQTPSLELYGRFGEPRIRRACGQIDSTQDAALWKYCDNLVTQFFDTYSSYNMKRRYH